MKIVYYAIDKNMKVSQCSLCSTVPIQVSIILGDSHSSGNIFESAKSSLLSSSTTSPSIFKTGNDKTFCLNDINASVNFNFIST